MVESVFHFFKIHREMIFGNSSVIVQNMLRKTPKPLDAIDVILAAVGKGLVMVQTVVLAPAFQGVVAAEGIHIIDRTLSGMRPDMSHEFVGSHAFHHLSIDPTIAFQEPKYNAFPGYSPSTLALAPAAEVGLVNFNLAFQLSRLKLRHMVERLPQALIDAGNGLVIKANVCGQTIRRLLLIESGDDRDFLAQLPQRFLAFASATLQITASGLRYRERTAKNALSPSQKVGRTVENVLFASNHKGILPPRGYESH